MFLPNMGLTRGYSAVGDYKMAMDWRKIAPAVVSDDNNSTTIERLLRSLEKEKD